MKGDQFIDEVRNLAELNTNEDAQQATQAMLETLRERLATNPPTLLPSSRQR
jgi:uncharacterized protein (DUF2267 family)